VAACLGELTTERGKGKINSRSLFETTLSLKSEKYHGAKRRVNERVLQYRGQILNLKYLISQQPAGSTILQPHCTSVQQKLRVLFSIKRFFKCVDTANSVMVICYCIT